MTSQNQQNLLQAADTVIDNEDQTVHYVMRSPALILADAKREVGLAADLVIDSDSMYQEAAEILSKIVGSKKTLDEKRLASGKPLRDQLNNINDGYKPAIDVLADGETDLKKLMANWVDAQERERKRLQKIADDDAEVLRKETLRLAEEARVKAEEDATRLREQAQREADERTRKADEEAAEQRRAAEEAAQSGDQQKAEELAQAAEATVANAATAANMILAHGDQSANDALELGAAEVEAHTQTAQVMTPAVMQVARPRATGTSNSKKYTGHIADHKKLLEFVLANYDHFAHWVEFDQGAINRYAQDQKERFNIPGAELRTETKIAARRAA
jgi:hypothetical protein